MKTLTIDETEFQVEEEVANLVLWISQERDKLKEEVTSVMCQAVGWTHTDNCLSIDKGVDIRTKNIPEMLNRAELDLGLK